MARSAAAAAFPASPPARCGHEKLAGRLLCRNSTRRGDYQQLAGGRALWSVEAVLQDLRRRRLEPRTVERVYEADVHPAVFDFAAWHQHRSRWRYLEHSITVFRSYFFRDLLGPLVVLVGTACCVGLYETMREVGGLPEWLPDFKGVSDTPFQLTSFALSLMLVFRTNSSYARWVDARSQWGLIVNTSRTFVRQAMTTLPESTCPEIREAVARWTIAFVRLSKMHLREGGDVAAEVQGLLLGEEVPLVAAAPHRPLAAAHVLSELLRTAQENGVLGEVARSRLEADVSALSQAMGACEKILRNPIPLSYTRHTSRFLILWLLWLPVAMWAKVGWCVVPVEAILTYLLLGIDEIAVQMEEPFGILPLENFCDAVQESVQQVASMDSGLASLRGAYACSTPHAARGEALKGEQRDAAVPGPVAAAAGQAAQQAAEAAAAGAGQEQQGSAWWPWGSGGGGNGTGREIQQMPSDRC